MSTPTAQDVAAFTGNENPPAGWTTKIDATLNIVTSMVRSYTRGNGFSALGEPGDDLAAVIVTCTARLASNPDLTRQQSVGPWSITQGQFNGWTLPELAILNTYRRRAM